MNQDQQLTFELMILLAVAVIILSAKTSTFLSALFTRQPYTVQPIQWPKLNITLNSILPGKGLG